MTTVSTKESWEEPDGLQFLSVPSTAYYGIQLPEGGVNPETEVLIALHGWGQSSRSFLRKFSSLKSQNILVIAPQAPHQFYLDRETRKIGFGWLTAFDRRRAIPDVIRGLDLVFSRVMGELGLSPITPFILGFSQGVSMAYRYAISGQQAVAGVIACGGDLPPDVEEGLPEVPRFPVLLVHGREDGIVPWSKAEAAERVLRSLSFAVDTHGFAGGHDLPGDLMSSLPLWMRKVRASGAT